MTSGASFPEMINWKVAHTSKKSTRILYFFQNEVPEKSSVWIGKCSELKIAETAESQYWKFIGLSFSGPMTAMVEDDNFCVKMRE